MTRCDKLEKLLKSNPKDTFLHFGLAMEYSKEQRPDDALAAFDKVLLLDPSYSAAHYHKGTLLISLGKTDEARKTLEDGLAAAKRNGDQHAEEEMKELLDSIT